MPRSAATSESARPRHRRPVHRSVVRLGVPGHRPYLVPLRAAPAPGATDEACGTGDQDAGHGLTLGMPAHAPTARPREQAYVGSMRIAVIGTGVVGRTLAQAFQRAGHDVVVGTRDPDETSGREEWAGLGVPLQPLATVAGEADLVVNATVGAVSLSALGRSAPTISPARCWSTSPTRWTSPRASRRP